MIDVHCIRKDFPILQETVYGKPLVYLDNAATTQKPLSVVRQIEKAYLKNNANIHRGVHYLSQTATEAHENARETIRNFINAHSTEEIIFTRGTTESINLVAYSFGESFCEEGDEIIISEMEHHSNIVPWQMLCERKKMTLKVLPFNDKGELLMNKLQDLISPKTKIIALTHISNVLGTINPIKEIIQLAHSYHIPVLIDGAQAIPHLKVDVKNLNADFYVFSAHKIYGPTGIGILYGKKEYLEQMQVYQGGGEMIDKVSFEKTTYNQLPFKFEAGTPDFIGSTALAEAIKYINKIGVDKIASYENKLLAYAHEQLASIPNLKFIGEAQNKSSVISFLLGNTHPYDVGSILDKLGIAVRTGHHCAQPIMDKYKIEGTVRASFSFYNTMEEIDILVESLKRVNKMFNR